MEQTLPSLVDCKKYSEKLCKTLEKIIEKVIPIPEEEQQIQKKINREFQLIKKELEKFKDTYMFERIELHGSVAKGTWLKDQIDLDVFIIFSEPKTKTVLENMIKDIARKMPFPFEIKHSEHPYLRIKPPKMYPADIVPAFDLGGKRFVSATDRTLYHTKFITSKIDKTKANETRLLKKFFKTVDVYGAEVKTQGFSGYATELLILKFNSMINVLEFIANNDKFIIKLEGEVEDPEKLYKKFNTSYILLDPVDSNRNTLAALSDNTYSRAKIASKLFLHNPTPSFFETQTIQQKPKLKERNIYVTKIEFKEKTPPDKKWGILKKLTKQLEKQLRKNKIEIIYLTSLEDKNENTYILLETTTTHTPTYIKITGPPATANVKDIEKFIKKHKNAIAGPWIEKNRLTVLEKAKPQTLEETIKTIITQLTQKYKDKITNIQTKKITETNNPEIIKHINRKEKWLLLE